MSRGDRLAAWIASRRRASLALGMAVAVAAAGLAVVTLGGGDDLAPDEARLRPDGVVEVSVDGAEFAAVDGDVVLGAGDRVRVLGGSAVLELADGSRGEMRTGSRVAVGGERNAALTLEGGELLAEVRDDTMVVDGGSAQVTVGAGASRLRRSASLVSGVYEGTLIVAGAGQALSLPALRQVSVAGIGRIPEAGGIRPLRLDEDDEWDRRFLGSVLELDRRLVAFGRGFEALVPESSADDPSLYEDLLPQLDGGLLTPELLSPRSAGENLIGLSLVVLAAGAFEDRVDTIFGLRDQGARWGLIAADRGLQPPEVVDAVEAAIDRTSGQIAGPGPSTTQPGGPRNRPSSPTTPPPTTQPPTTSPGPGGGPGGTTTTTALVTLPTLPGGGGDNPPGTTTTTSCGAVAGLLGFC